MDFSFDDYVEFYRKDIRNSTMHYRNKMISEYMCDEKCFSDDEFDYLNHSYISINGLNNYTRLIRENEKNDIIVDEGLIKTYPVKTALTRFKVFCKNSLPDELYDLKLSQTERVKLHDIPVLDMKDSEYADNNEVKDKINFIFPFYKDQNLSEFIKNLSDYMYICGYNYANMNIWSIAVQPFHRKIQLVNVIFEAKYHHDEFEFSPYLYHVTAEQNLPRIKKHGLVPSSKSDKFSYPNRVYLFNDASKNIILDYIRSKFKDSNEACVLKIKSSNLMKYEPYSSGKMLFYADPMFSSLEKPANAIFTYNTISPALIENDILKLKLSMPFGDILEEKIISLKTMGVGLRK